MECTDKLAVLIDEKLNGVRAQFLLILGKKLNEVRAQFLLILGKTGI